MINKEIHPRLINCPGCCAAPQDHKSVYSGRIGHSGRFFGKRCRVVCCSKCGLTFLNPMFSAQDYSDFYCEDYFQLQNLNDKDAEQRFVQRMDMEMAHYLNPFIDDAVVDWPQNPHYLDVGAGCFPAVEIFARRGIVNKKNACALEPNVKAAACLAKNFGIDVCTEGLENNPYPPSSFDLVSALALIEHVTDPLAAISALRDALAPNGLLLLSTPALDSAGLNNGPLRFFKVVHTLYLAEHSLRRLLHANNFEIIEFKIMPALNGYNVLVCLARKIERTTVNLEDIGDSMDEVRRVRNIIRSSRKAHPLMWYKQRIRSMMLGLGVRL